MSNGKHKDFMIKYELLMQQKFGFESQNVSKYQEVQQLRRDMLSNIKKLDQIENEIRELFGKPRLKRADIRHG